ncbi:MAG: type II 3-dehydroquinate dehydratase [Alphaproteobacteria bacterium]|nr:type II 3-dehydroquinate dehydratase [Alphaproteobacteria bacterium]
MPVSPLTRIGLPKQRHNILILNGPNLNMLGSREPEIYGIQTLTDIANDCEEYAGELGFTIDFRQSNSEGELVTFIQQARGAFSGVVINAGAYTHTSIAIHDALKILEMPVIEVHLSNPQAREAFRHHSYISPVAKGTICGFGGHGYILALNALRSLLDDEG